MQEYTTHMENNNTTTNVNTNGPFFFAIQQKMSRRAATRFDRLFASRPDGAATFVQLNNTPRYASAISTLLFACKDHGLDRNGLTRSQIVMSYNKSQKLLELVAKYIEINGVESALSKILNANIPSALDVQQTRAEILRALAA